MNLEKLFGSKTKSDILKYLVFRRQWVSIRALESELGRTFPGIKKQIDSLEEAHILTIDKSPDKWSIAITNECFDPMRNLILSSLTYDIYELLKGNPMVEHIYLGKVFHKPIDVDLVILYPHNQNNEVWLEELKKHITSLLKSYMIDPAYLVFMDNDEFTKRTKMADKFALQVLRSNQ